MTGAQVCKVNSYLAQVAESAHTMQGSPHTDWIFVGIEATWTAMKRVLTYFRDDRTCSEVPSVLAGSIENFYDRQRSLLSQHHRWPVY